jgi:hypothetical protein
MSGDAKLLLINELASGNVNILKIKNICKENPGIISATGLRLKVWALLLLGSSDYTAFDADIDNPTENCGEQQVLEADVHRTRADVEEFRSTSWRQTIHAILQSFCLTHGIQYKQGMNEVRL